MDIDTLKLMIEAARAGGFAEAARRRGVDPSSVSRAVAALERDLGARLFQRTTRKIALTEAGAAFLPRAEAAVEELEAARDAARRLGGGLTGLLRLSASVAFGERVLIPRLAAFRARFPDLRLDLLLTDERLDLVAAGVDLAIRLGPAVDGDLIAAKWVETRYRVCAAPGYLKRTAPIRRPTDLADHRCLVLTLPAHRDRWRFQDGGGTVEEVAIRSDFAVSNPLALRAAAVAGLGPALLADWLAAEDLAAERLVDLFPDRRAGVGAAASAAWFVYPSRTFLPEKVRATIDFLRAHPP